MKPPDKIKIILEIADRLASADWSSIDLTLREFGLRTEKWCGSKSDYIVEMIQGADDQSLLDLADYLEIALVDNISKKILPHSEVKELIQEIDNQKNLMIAVATGGPRIQEVNEEYKQRRILIMSKLKAMGIQDPNTYPDLWSWYGKWKDMLTYQSRRHYITNLYQPVIDSLMLSLQQREAQQVIEPTGWARVDRNIDKIVQALAHAKNEEDYQAVGLLCREAIISLAQAVYHPNLHPSLDGVKPSETDAKRMLDSYIATELSGSSNEALRKYVKDAYQLAVTLQHKRNANFREAALCVEATRSVGNAIAIISGQRDPYIDF